MRVGFLNNQIDNRGTGNALFDYAHYNEEILGNESIILTLDTQFRDTLMERRLIERFGSIKHVGDYVSLDVLYHIKSGSDDGFKPNGVKYCVHGVFDKPSGGDVNAAVSPWLATLYDVPYVPHIVSLPPDIRNLRETLSLQGYTVLGRHGGADSFDIGFVWDAIGATLDRRADVAFVFMNTDGIPHEIKNSPRVRVLPPTSDPLNKRLFINTCDGMIHARRRGETFGIAVGEFAISGKPIITFGGSYEQNHYLELPYAEKYNNKEELIEILLNFKGYNMPGYLDYKPDKVMKKFKEVFLD